MARYKELNNQVKNKRNSSDEGTTESVENTNKE